MHHDVGTGVQTTRHHDGMCVNNHCSLMQRRMNLEQLVTSTCRCREHVILCCAVIFNGLTVWSHKEHVQH
jgi:hypothetical protein